MDERVGPTELGQHRETGGLKQNVAAAAGNAVSLSESAPEPGRVDLVRCVG